MENNPPSYTLEDLSAESGFDTRVIRHFIEQGLLRGPTSLGRYARYSDRHLVRLLAIKALKENRGMKLTDTRQTLLCMSEPEIDALAETVRTCGSDGANAPGSALDYLRSLNLQTFDSQADQVMSQAEKRRLQLEKQSTSSQNQSSSGEYSQGRQSKVQESESSKGSQGNTQSQTNTQELFFNSPDGAPTSPRQFAPSETLHRFQITPDVELSVRGLQTEQQIARMQNVANRLREFLIGGSNE